jgi:hypothetical protein
VGPLEVGIYAKGIIRTAFTDKVYGPGFWYTGLTGKFFKYPTNIQIMEFSSDGVSDGPTIKGWSSDGQLLEIEISFFYKLQSNRTAEIFLKYEDAWRLPLVRRCWGTIVTEATKWNTTDFFVNRDDIKIGLFNSLSAVLDEQAFSLIDVQLRQLNIPDAFEDAIAGKQVAAQNIITTLQQRQLILVNANTTVIQGKYSV